MKLRVLLYGGGAREHAIAWKLTQSPLLEKLYLCNSNDGFSDLGEVIDVTDFSELALKAKFIGIDLLIVGPEEPLVNGIVDEFKKQEIAVIGPDKYWAGLEGSKLFAKRFMARNNIPTADYAVINEKNKIKETLEKFNFPLVIKADGLAAGKGVTIVHDYNEANRAIKEYLDGKFAEASKTVIIEEYLEGEELSLISIWDGKTLLPLIPARDFKKLLDDDKGPNTGGMGAFCPVILNCEQQDELDLYINKLENALKNEGADFTGIIYSGLILTHDGLKVLEYNMRFGDPETQPLLLHMENDLLEIFNSAIQKRLNEVRLKWNNGTSFCLVIASGGYPDKPAKGALIENIQEILDKYDVRIFYAGVKKIDNKLTANGGRVLSICKTGNQPQNDVYLAAKELNFIDKYYRTDIGNKITKS